MMNLVQQKYLNHAPWCFKIHHKSCMKMETPPISLQCVWNNLLLRVLNSKPWMIDPFSMKLLVQITPNLCVDNTLSLMVWSMLYLITLNVRVLQSYDSSSFLLVISWFKISVFLQSIWHHGKKFSFLNQKQILVKTSKSSNITIENVYTCMLVHNFKKINFDKKSPWNCNLLIRDT